jgi:ubiquinone/menaquinone biosynthesis C-methylase UbiE
MDAQTSPPNHHAQFPAFSGITGIVAALSMTFGRKGDARFAVQLSGMEPGDTLVDIGCGPGVAVRYAVRSGATAIGVDPAPVMLWFAKHSTRHLSNVRFVEGVAEALPLSEGSVSVVWSIATVHHWTDIDAGLGEVQRVLVPGGRFVTIERTAQEGARGHASHGWTDEQVVAFMDRCRERGYTDIRKERATAGRRSLVGVVANAPS